MLKFIELSGWNLKWTAKTKRVVVLATLGRVNQNLVRNFNATEVVRCPLLAVLVGVVLERQLSKRLLDLLSCSVALDLEDLVVVRWIRTWTDKRIGVFSPTLAT